MRGSKYELKFDFQGKPVNDDEIRHVLKKGANDGSGQVLTGLGTATAGGNASMNFISQVSNQMDNDMQNQSNSNMSHHMSKDHITGALNSQKNLNQPMIGTKKKMASDDEYHMND